MNRDRPFPPYEIRTKVNEVLYRAIRLQLAGLLDSRLNFVTMLEFQTRWNALYRHGLIIFLFFFFF